MTSFHFLCHLLLISVLLSVNLYAYAQSETDYKQQLDTLAATIEQLQKELADTTSSRDKLQQSLQESEEEISSLIQKIDLIKEELSREKKHLNQLQRRRAELETSRHQQQQRINRIIRQAYTLGRQSQIKLLLNQVEPYRVSRLLRYHHYIVSAHKVKLDDYLATITQISSVETTITATIDRLEFNRQRLDQRFRELKDSQSQRLAILARLNKELSDKDGTLMQMRNNQQYLEKLLNQATQALSQLQLPGDAQPFQQLKGKLPFPADGRITHHYGSSRLKGKLHWNGLFISGAIGSEVVSVHRGHVIFSDYLRGQGLLLIIDHGDGYMSLYAHNQTLLKDTGDWVDAGEAIATLGNTGGLSQAGLYFEIRHKGKPQNPGLWISRK